MTLNPAELILMVAGVAAAAIGVARDVRARTRWRVHGLGLIDPETGAATEAVAAVQFPVERELAVHTGNTLVLALFRAHDAHPERVGKALMSEVRRHETLYRLDFDLFALVLVVQTRAEAVATVARIGTAVSHMSGTLLSGVAELGPDGEEFYSLVDAAHGRLAPIERFAQVARAVSQPA